jgi:succinate dehydrogenase (ubiquinone) flavoprotein subunit
MIFQDRVDEYDYKEALEGQTAKPLDQHWRKHTLSYQDHKTGKVSKLQYVPIVGADSSINKQQSTEILLRE